jgi:hypothetical protein
VIVSINLEIVTFIDLIVIHKYYFVLVCLLGNHIAIPR